MQSPTWKARAAELRALLPLGVGEQTAVLRDANLNFSCAAGFGSVNEAVAVDFRGWERVS
jgi:hypothetical protein